MKPFYLDDAFRGYQICTRDGHAAEMISYEEFDDFPVKASIINDNGKWHDEKFTEDGKFMPDEDSLADLFMAEENDKPLKGEEYIRDFYAIKQ
jgi:hypothetical protein